MGYVTKDDLFTKLFEEPPSVLGDAMLGVKL